MRMLSINDESPSIGSLPDVERCNKVLKMNDLMKRIIKLKEVLNKEYGILRYKRLELFCTLYITVWASLLFALGILMPSLISSQVFGVLRHIKSALMENNAGILLEGAILLNFANTIRTAPIYFAAMLLSDAFRITKDHKRYKILEIILFCLISLFTIWVSYTINFAVHGLRYGFGMHSILIIYFVIFIDSQEIRRIKPRMAFLVMNLFVFGVQFLEIIPALSWLGLGKGELSVYIKNASLLIGAERILTLVSVTVFFVSILTSFIIVKLVVDDYRLRSEMQKKEALEKQLYRTRMEAVEMRTFREIQSLVHDLKAPLTTIEGLASLTKLITLDPKVIEYQGKICSSSEKMSVMISEILYEEKKSFVETDSLMKMALANIQGLKHYDCIAYVNTCGQSLVRVNKIRMVRAIVNIIQNALAAIGENGKISISVNKKGRLIEFKIIDNGKGINPEELERIWEIGYSGNQSTGMGLSFVRSVVNNHEGEISIESGVGKYTCVTINLRSNEKWKSQTS